MKKSPKVLICPLDWGIGHATRCVPIIHNFLSEGFEVVIATDRKPYHFLKEEFPELQFVRFPGVEISYSNGGILWLKMLLDSPKILWGIFKEHHWLKRYLKKYKFDLIFSDNRYGCWNTKTHSIFMTHQTNIKTPAALRVFKPLINLMNHFFIHKYDRLWIPDNEGIQSISSDLSSTIHLKIPHKHIGILSRFNDYKLESHSKPVELLAILSGPEPQRSHFEELLIEEIKRADLKAILVRGLPQEKELFKKDNILYLSHCTSKELANYIQAAQLVICRPGYSSMMDLACFGTAAVVVPTPGQTEQEYLAFSLDERKIHLKSNQEDLNLGNLRSSISNYTGLHLKNDYQELRSEIKDVIEML